MATSFGALCNDFYINTKLAVKMDMPSDRETVLHLYDRVRKSMPDMDSFRRFDEEVALESSRSEAEYRWTAIRQHSLRVGHVNPQSMASGFELHELMLELAPFNLSVSALDIDYLELLFGFDLECKANQDRVVAEALFGESPLAQLMQMPSARPMDVQPVVGFALSEKGDQQCNVEVKTRRRGRRGGAGRYRGEPISIFLTLRQYGPVDKIEDLKPLLQELASKAEAIALDRVLPNILTPIARYITSGT